MNKNQYLPLSDEIKFNKCEDLKNCMFREYKIIYKREF